MMYTRAGPRLTKAMIIQCMPYRSSTSVCCISALNEWHHGHRWEHHLHGMLAHPLERAYSTSNLPFLPDKRAFAKFLSHHPGVYPQNCLVFLRFICIILLAVNSKCIKFLVHQPSATYTEPQLSSEK